MAKTYFKHDPDAPASLRVTVSQRVRFEECDPLGIVWHGRYTSYFEDARVAFGTKHGIGYMDFFNHGVSTPLKQMYHEYIRPLKFQDEFTTECILHWSDAARLNYEFIVRNANGETTTTGYTVQMMLDKNFEVLLAAPTFYNEFCKRWKDERLND